MRTKKQPEAKHVESILFPRLDEGSTPSSSTKLVLDGCLTSKTTEQMKAIKVVKIVGITAIIMLFVTLISSGFIFEATHKVAQDVILPTDFNILQVETIIITALSITYALLLFPWLLYFIKIEKKSGLQYLSLYPMTSGKIGKIVSIALTTLNAVTVISFYIQYIAYTQNTNLHLKADSQLSILTILCLAIIFWGGIYLIYGSLYGAKRMKNIINKKRERRKARRK